MNLITLAPPAPAEHWPPGLALVAGQITATGIPVFESTGQPWSAARRIDHGVQLEWKEVTFEVTAHRVVVDATDPVAMVDLYWNTLVATVLELRGITCLHGFMVESPSGEGLAVLGLSGAGKTTTGRALLERGCTLVCDDLLTLDIGAVPHGRPFYRRVPENDEKGDLVVGGKIREAQRLAVQIPSLDRVLSLDERVRGDGILKADLIGGIDHLLRSPYVPFEITPGTAAQRMETAAQLVATTSIHCARPRSRTPAEFADLLLSGGEK